MSNEEKFIRGASRATIALIRLNLNTISFPLVSPFSFSISHESVAKKDGAIVA